MKEEPATVSWALREGRRERDGSRQQASVVQKHKSPGVSGAHAKEGMLRGEGKGEPVVLRD